MRDAENTSYDLRYGNYRQLIGFSEGVYDTQDTFILPGFSLFGRGSSWVHTFINGRVYRRPGSILYIAAHPPSHICSPVHELLVCVGFIKVFEKAVITSPGLPGSELCAQKFGLRSLTFSKRGGADPSYSAVEPSPSSRGATSPRTLATLTSLPLLSHYFDVMCACLLRIANPYHRPLIVYLHTCIHKRMLRCHVRHDVDSPRSPLEGHGVLSVSESYRIRA